MDYEELLAKYQALLIQVIFGADPVAVDTYAATLFRIKPTEIGYLMAAAEYKLV